MRTWLLILLILPITLLAVSCGPLQKEFYINAINTQEEKVVCAILQEDEVLYDKNNQAILSPATVILTFKMKSDGSDWEKIKIGVKAVEKDAEGKVIRGLKQEEESPYLEDNNSFRYVQPNDARTQLFILRRNKNYGGGTN
ncbi:MAG: hypothetical protein HY717_15600 [Planctomycetes bacterium]|nr:hypothetical protein [Planctomycetota bacterium]